MRVILFQKQFVPKILDGSKHTTIRCKARCKPGDELSLRYWSGKPYRSKQVEFKRVICKSVAPIQVGIGGIVMDSTTMLDGSPDVESIAKADGFDTFWLMRCWYQDNHGNLPFSGELISW